MSTPADTLSDLTYELAGKRRELGEMLAAAREQRVRAFEESGLDSVSAADRYADAVVLDLDCDIIKLKADIAAAETEWQYLMATVPAAAT